MKLTIKSIYVNDRKMDGTPFINKKGEAYSMANLEFELNGETKKASMYLGKVNAKEKEVLSTWSSGQEVEVVLEQNGSYTNFRLPSKTDALNETVENHETRITKLEKVLSKYMK